MDLSEAASAIVLAEDAKSDAQGALLAAIERHGALAERVAALSGERDAIVARRAAGDCRDDDGARLALLGADMEGLRGLVDRAESGVTDARASLAAAERALAARQREFRTREDLAALAAVGAEADALITLLGKALAARQTIADRLPAHLAPALLTNQVTRGQSLATLLANELGNVWQRASAVPVQARPKWPVEDRLYNVMMRLRLNNGAVIGV